MLTSRAQISTAIQQPAARQKRCNSFHLLLLYFKCPELRCVTPHYRLHGHVTEVEVFFDKANSLIHTVVTQQQQLQSEQQAGRDQAARAAVEQVVTRFKAMYSNHLLLTGNHKKR